MAFLTDYELKKHLADILRVKGGAEALPPSWDSIIKAANAEAQTDITAALGLLGYSPTQVAAWDRIASFNRGQALYYAMRDGAVTIDFPQARIDALDRRKELGNEPMIRFQFTVNGQVQPPAASRTGDPVGGRGVYSGRLSQEGYRITNDTSW